MKPEKDSIGFLIIKYGIYIILGGLILMKLCGYSFQEIIYNYKAKREMETIHYGGSVSEVNKHIIARNKKVEELTNLTNNIAKEINTILYYTNDTTTISSALIQANRQYRSNYVNPYQIGRNYIAESEETIKYINEFEEKVDSLGYNIFIDRGKGNEFLSNIFEKNLRSEICIKNVNKEDDENKYIIIQLRYYSDNTKQLLTKKIEDRKPTWFVAVGSTPEKEIALLNEIQYSTAIFTEKELQAQKLDFNGLKSLFAPRLDVSKNSTFYFSCYNKKMDSLTFLKKIELFKNMFLKKQPNIKGRIKSTKVILNQNEDQ
ncbi:hypothetical protein SAMN04487910_2729 [Aquimarina amphilecti]|uniref:Uncharacterized protein n=1 Tax=Aquimarina amphilecti TaxID=1038014 RepID=A0A1H7QYH5_AQUAM|nr:hypothetical protein [Aquimarina amphilecti]SEL52899.1 hypothetical protein SAMN04487910_2729 [Aquimarina amphilecti]